MGQKYSDVLKAAIRKLGQIADELQSGNTFPVTRLTIIKRLCSDSAVSNRFALHVAETSLCKMRQRTEAEIGEYEEWTVIFKAAEEAMASLRAFFDPENPSGRSNTLPLQLSYNSLKQAQDVYRKIPWGTVRCVSSTEAIIIENAINCVLMPNQAERLCYQIAKDFTERYNSRYGTGLLPESAESVRTIADFWRHELRNITRQTDGSLSL